MDTRELKKVASRPKLRTASRPDGASVIIYDNRRLQKREKGMIHIIYSMS